MKELIFIQGVCIMKKALLLGMVIVLALAACSPNRQKLTPQSNLNLKSANVYYQQKDNDKSLEKALDLYEKVLADNPKHVVALKRSADLNYFFALKAEPRKEEKDGITDYFNMDSSVKTVEHLKITYTKCDTILSVMKSFVKLNKEEQYIKRDAAKKKNNSWLKILKISQLLMENKIYEEAISNLEYLVKLDNTKEEPLRMLVILYQDTKNNAKFEEYLNKVLAINPNDPLMLKLLGVHYYNAKDYANAAIYFEKIMSINLADTENLSNLTNAYYELGNYQAAWDTNQRILKIDPESLAALITAKDIAKKMGKQEEEIYYMQQIIAKNPTVETLRAYCYMMVNYQRYEGLIDYAEQWYDMDKTNKEAVQMCYAISQKINRKDLMAKYEAIYKLMP